MAKDFYMKLYKTEGGRQIVIGPSLLPTFTHSDRHLLNRPVAHMEDKNAFFEMGPNKALGPNSFLPAFFKQY